MTDPDALRRIVAEGRERYDAAKRDYFGMGFNSVHFGNWVIANLPTLFSALESRALSAQQIREDAAKGIDSRVKWLMHEAHNGGNWDHLKARADEATFLAEWLRALKSAPPSEPSPDRKQRP